MDGGPRNSRYNCALAHSLLKGQNASNCRADTYRACSVDCPARFNVPARPRPSTAHTWTCPMNSFTQPAPFAALALCDSCGHNSTPIDRLVTPAHGGLRHPGHFGRRKRWNHWCITTPHWMLSFYPGRPPTIWVAAAYFLDLETGQAAAYSRSTCWVTRAMICQTNRRKATRSTTLSPALLRVAEQAGRSCITINASNIGWSAVAG